MKTSLTNVNAFAAVLAISALILGIGLLRAGVQADTHAHGHQESADPDWSQLIASMDKMHMAMGAVERSGDDDVDFVAGLLFGDAPAPCGLDGHGAGHGGRMSASG